MPATHPATGDLSHRPKDRKQASNSTAGKEGRSSLKENGYARQAMAPKYIRHGERKGRSITVDRLSHGANKGRTRTLS